MDLLQFKTFLGDLIMFSDYKQHYVKFTHFTFAHKYCFSTQLEVKSRAIITFQHSFSHVKYVRLFFVFIVIVILIFNFNLEKKYLGFIWKIVITFIFRLNTHLCLFMV